MPVSDANGYDAAVTTLRLRPKGTMPGNGGGNPYFELRFRVTVKRDRASQGAESWRLPVYLASLQILASREKE